MRAVMHGMTANFRRHCADSAHKITGTADMVVVSESTHCTPDSPTSAYNTTLCSLCCRLTATQKQPHTHTHTHAGGLYAATEASAGETRCSGLRRRLPGKLIADRLNVPVAKRRLLREVRSFCVHGPHGDASCVLLQLRGFGFSYKTA